MRSQHHFCLECRVPLGLETQCDGGPRHRVVALGTQQGREKLRSAVWGPPPLRRALRESALAGVGGGAIAGALETCAVAPDLGCALCQWLFSETAAAAIAGVMSLAALLAMVIYIGLLRLMRAIRHGPARPPTGAIQPIAPRRPAATQPTAMGVVLPCAKGVDTFGASTTAVARALWLRRAKADIGPLMLADACAAAFSVELDDGRRVEIPAGRVRLFADPAAAQSLGRSAIAQRLAHIDPLRRADDDEFDPIPFDEASVTCLEPGDRVALHGALKPGAEQPGGSPAAYREVSSRTWVPVGVPLLSRAP